MHALWLAQRRLEPQAWVPSVSVTQQPLTQSELRAQVALHRVPQPRLETQRVGTPWSSQHSRSVLHVAPTARVQPATQPPAALQEKPALQVPQEPPHPSGPQPRPPQFGVQELTQRPCASLHTRPAGHCPQVPPQPLSPQPRPAQLGLQLVPPSPSAQTQAPKPLPEALQDCAPVRPLMQVHA